MRVEGSAFASSTKIEPTLLLEFTAEKWVMKPQLVGGNDFLGGGSIIQEVTMHGLAGKARIEIPPSPCFKPGEERISIPRY